jgi:lactoylglutathione lyase
MLEGRPLDHIGLATNDIGATIDWYVNVLGFELYGEFTAPDGTPCKFIRGKGNGKDVKYEVFQPVCGVDPAVAGKIDHISFESDDIERDYDYCMSLNLKCTTGGIQTMENFWEKGCRYFKVAGATGEEIEFCQIL